MEVLFLLSRTLSSVAANVFQKTLTQQTLHPLAITFASYLVLLLICLPLLLWVEVSALPTTFWLNITLAALLDMAGTLFLVMSLSKTDLSIFGPLNAYKVVFSMLLAGVFLHEIPSLQGVMGVTIIVLGSLLLIPPRKAQHSRLKTLLTDTGVRYRFLSIALFSLGTLPLKSAVLSGGALPATVFWCLIGLPLAAVLYLLFNRQPIHHDIAGFKLRLPSVLALGSLIFIMQYATLVLFSGLLIAYALALFQVSMVLQVLLGYRLFREGYLWQRLGACLVMIVGCALVLTT